MYDSLPIRKTCAEINLDNLRHNLSQFRKHVGDKRIMAVVKADGYGHGAVEIAQEALNQGANCLAVAVMEEGIELRKADLAAPILILGYTPPDHMETCLKYGITPTIFTEESAQALSNAAVRLGKRAFFHIKVDTGMGRLGIMPQQVTDFVKLVDRFPALKLEGIFTHFSVADEDHDYTNQQLKQFNQALTKLEKEGIHVPIKHAANSAGTIGFPESHLDMVRIGLSLYGLYPEPGMEKFISLKPVMSIKTRISHLKTVPAGTSIGYGRSYITDRETVVGTLPIGYADGYFRLLSNQGQVLLHGQRVPIIGSVCMDQCMIDVSKVPEATIGDDVMMMGEQGEERVTADEIADKVGTISHEVVCSADKRVPRIYLKNGRAVKTKTLTSILN